MRKTTSRRPLSRDSKSCSPVNGKLLFPIFLERGDKCVNHLASRGHLLPLGYHSISYPDPVLLNYIMYDCQEISKPRLVLNED
ncbi:unnamed protein product [Linum tenue]|uniref:Porphobilinogen synthase n=1 Tax=Linum tenue TaxID=586396 RepID=A0AAV0ISM8_9ROSI|nr:unnamed protein product [Linum tenue]